MSKREMKRRIEHLENLVEKETRTKRHLEQYSDIARSQENLEHARQVQQERRNEINNLENIIVTGEHSNNNQLENIEKRYKYTQGYISHNANHMDKETLHNAEEKQQNRKDQMDLLK